MNTALLMLEFQNDYFANGRTPLDKSLDACTKAESVLHASREKGIPVIHIQHISTHPDASCMLPCTKGANFNPAVQPVKNETIIKKHYPNSFKDTSLLKLLIKNHINHLIICGMMTQMAVDATVRAAYDLGFSCTIVSDACAAAQLVFNHTTITAQDVHYAFLAALQSCATIINSDDFLQKTGARIAAVA